MNREQAEHILEAYVRMRMRESDKDASDALREVILDAMTSYKVTTTSSITWPNTYPLTVPNVISNKPIITCTGVDPAFGTKTVAVEERAEG